MAIVHDDEMIYYCDQLKKLDLDSEYPLKIKITSDNGETQWLNLNDKSIWALYGFLDELAVKLNPHKFKEFANDGPDLSGAKQ